MVGQGDGEQEFVVLASVQGAGIDVHIEFLSHYCGLVVNGDALLIDAAAGTALLADMYEFR